MDLCSSTKTCIILPSRIAFSSIPKQKIYPEETDEHDMDIPPTSAGRSRLPAARLHTLCVHDVQGLEKPM